MVIRRGEIWWAELPEPEGSEPGFRRPVVIVQADDFNRSNLRTVIVIALTSNVKWAGSPGNVLLPRKKTGLPSDSVANVTQCITIDKQTLSDRARTIPQNLLLEIDAGLRLVLSL